MLDVSTANLARKDDAADHVGDFDVWLARCERMRFTASLINSLSNLKLQVTTGGNNREIYIEGCIPRGITVSGKGSAPGRTTEQVWAMIQSLKETLYFRSASSPGFS
jgi:phosphoglycerate dehydrogenase-like enzyme